MAPFGNHTQSANNESDELQLYTLYPGPGWVLTGNARGVLRKGVVRVADLAPHHLHQSAALLLMDRCVSAPLFFPEIKTYCVQVIHLSVPSPWKHLISHGNTLGEHSLLAQTLIWHVRFLKVKGQGRSYLTKHYTPILMQKKSSGFSLISWSLVFSKHIV